VELGPTGIELREGEPGGGAVGRHRPGVGTVAEVGNGYVTDIPYTRGFFPELAPAWLDFVATIAGVASPTRPAGFSWCELGCGQGVTTAILAAAHPQGQFVGIDLMPEHVDHARRLAHEAAVGNVAFHAASYADERVETPTFDYIVAHGVYAWVDAKTQAGLRHFIDRHLRPGGLVYLSYNAMPRWAAELPFQRLLLALARGLPGDSAARFAAAARRLRPLIAAGAPSLAASAICRDLDAFAATHAAAYLAHEFMGQNWQPLFVDEVRRPLAKIGLRPAGSATIAENFDSFVLRRTERAALAVFDDPDLRELVRDVLKDTGFRRDVYSRGGTMIGDSTRRNRLMMTRYALTRPVETVEFTAEMPGAGNCRSTIRLLGRSSLGWRRGRAGSPTSTPPALASETGWPT
jgi:SAM-dependent methyltransferase